ncbi:protein kinase [Streptomyces luomodiensis]|uniref:Protein kinase n=1 Tax=Streptomyces luomodiensis TaxID=3026192 RepID=A0ABY9V5F9_9ACTN|nr:protein kinase [Streptomyces sp. SCA4-21]WNE99240.1 protein kinase [Streptomyces sp. SCA4-21]
MAHPLTHDDPQRLGPYTLVARLGSGGMGTVYLGRSSGGRTVALKTMHARFASEAEFRTRFRLETDAARVIGGRYGAQVIDADTLAPTPWLATEYVLGPPLDDAVALGGALPERAVRALGAALCDALAQLHRSDVVHRDLKPSNILLTALGPKVIDFGIARAVGDDRLTRTGAAAGTPAYMSPEQVAGGEHAAAGDVFALAGVLVFAATGRPPFGGGQPADLLYRVRYTDPDLSGLPGELRTVLEPCFAKDPGRRPGTAELGPRLHDGGGHFADHLPDPVLAEIARLGAAVWEIQPSRTPAPVAEGTTAGAHRPPGPAGISRRKAVTIGGGGAVAAAAAAAWVWLRPDGGASGSAARTPAPTTRPPGTPPRMSWKVTPPSDTAMAECAVLLAGDHAAIIADTGLYWIDPGTGARRGTNDLVTKAQHAVFDGRRLLACDSSAEHVRIAPVDPGTGNFRTPLATVKDLETDDVRLLAATSDTVFLEGTSRKGPVRMAIDARTGEERWRRASDTPEFQDPLATPAGSSLVLSFRERVTVVDAADGSRRWSKMLAKENYLILPGTRRHTFSDGLLYVGGKDLLAVRLSDGEVVWRFGEGRKAGDGNEPESARYGPPLLRDGVVYSLETGTGLVAVDARSGKPRWEQKKGTGPALNFRPPPALGKRYLYAFPDVGTDQWATAIDLRGHKAAWTFQGPGTAMAAVNPTMTVHRGADRLIIAGGSTVCAIPLE